MIHRTARTVLVLATVLLVGAVDADAQWSRSYESLGQLRFRFGLFEPSGSSAGWDDVFEGFTGQSSDLDDMVWGGDYLWRFGGGSGVMFGGSYYRGSTRSAYRDWVAGDGSDVRHTTRLELSDLTVAFVHRFGTARVRPYIGAGGGLLWWRLVDQGDFIDFGDPELPVFSAWYGADGTTFEAVGLAGLEIPLSPVWGVLIEGRYRWAGDTLGDDFADFGDLDLSGWELSGGFGINF